MGLEPNKLRAKLNDGHLVCGSVIYSWSPAIMDQAGFAGLDFIRIDSEHAWRQDGAMEGMVRAALAAGVAPILRVDRDNPYLIRKALEIGAEGIIVPDVHSADDAANVVRASKFPPRGIRGYGSNCVAGGWGTKAGPEWVEWSDREPMIGIMIEHVEAMDRLDDIFAVDGVDFALFGPSDYSMSLGVGTGLDVGDERIVDAVTKTCAAAKKAGKHVMLGVGMDASTVRRYADIGVTMMEMGNDAALVRAAWMGAAKTVAALPGAS
ncbi:MAG: aldolase/citrate lyase family protein [Rhodospirillales bacterium]|jgi:4-hydroxy-2-oxoheptanedioate aldolase|nr:aldolase/citrate lyase family protein [Rhodospirillales bacterium]HJO97823.1 aldolase/citrate lyase family protein [Rhodospirillales bacterium]